MRAASNAVMIASAAAYFCQAGTSPVGPGCASAGVARPRPAVPVDGAVSRCAGDGDRTSAVPLRDAFVLGFVARLFAGEEDLACGIIIAEV